METTTVQPIINPVDRSLLLSELVPERKARETKRGSNEIYIFTAAECPHLMLEVGRLREVSFRGAGGGCGKEVDIDEDDTVEGGYNQLIVWDPAAQEIVGGYRFIVSDSENPKYMSTEHYFRFSDKFRHEYLPYTIELGRSFVQPAYQLRSNRKSIYALDNLWDGLGALIVLNPEARYFFGKVTMYTSYASDARDALIYFLKKYFPDKEGLVTAAKDKLDFDLSKPRFKELFCGGSYEADYKIMVQEVRRLDESVPPLINAYMNLSPSMKVFDTVSNPDFGGVEETGIMITINDIYAEKVERYIRWEGWMDNLRSRRDAFKKRLFTSRRKK